MFGTLKMQRAAVDEESRLEHTRFYCGMCKTLGSEFGQPLRATLSNDAVFMALLADAFLEEGAAEASYRCPLVPARHRAAVDHNSPAMRYGGAVQILLGDQWLADRAMDGQRLPRLARPLVRAPVARAQGLLGELGIDFHALEGFEFRQKRTEAGEPAPSAAAEPTASALSLIFEAVADLPEAVPAIRTGTGRKRLRRLGAAVGQVIYLMDALEDLEEDRRLGNFNPILEDGAVAPVRLEGACRDLELALKRIRGLVGALPWQRHRQVVTNILCVQLAGRAGRAIEAARDGVEHSLSWRQRLTVGRPIAAAVTLLGSWLLAAPALAFGGRAQECGSDDACCSL